MAFTLIPTYLVKARGFENRKLMVIFSLCVLFGIFMKIDYFYNSPVNLYYYIGSTCFLLTFTLAAEVCFTSMFSTITPDHIIESFWNAGNPTP